MEHFEPFTPTPEQSKNNPNKFWEGFLGQKVKLLSEKLLAVGNITDGVFTATLDEVMSEVPKNKADFISKDEMTFRVLELIAKDNNGFPDEKLKKAYIEKLASYLSEKLKECEFDEVDQKLQEEIIEIEKSGTLDKNSIEKLKNDFAHQFSDLKMKEYAEELG